MLITPEEKYANLYKEMYKLCVEQNWGEPFSYARSKEILLANMLGHTIADTFSGADAFNQDGKPVEYKTTNGLKIQGSYTGISRFLVWSDQEHYLRFEKIGKYEEHYYARFEDGHIAEIWMLTGQQVLDILLPKLKRKFETSKKNKDPRLSAIVTNSEITKLGKRVL